MPRSLLTEALNCNLFHKGTYLCTYFLIKNEQTNKIATSPAKPLSPTDWIIDVRFEITSRPNTPVPVRTWKRIVTGSRAVNSANNPPRNPFMYLNTESIVISPIYKFCDNIVVIKSYYHFQKF